MQKGIVDLIVDHLREKSMTKAGLAKKLNVSRQSLSQSFRKRDLDCGFVLKISTVLEHDFFSDISRQLPAEIRAKKSDSSTSKLEFALKEFIENNYPKIK